MLQSFSEGYTANRDVPFMLYVTKLYRVAWALSATLLDTNPDNLLLTIPRLVVYCSSAFCLPLTLLFVSFRRARWPSAAKELSVWLVVWVVLLYAVLFDSWKNVMRKPVYTIYTDQPTHLRSLISIFVVRCLDSVIPILEIAEISIFWVLTGRKPRRQVFLWRDSFSCVPSPFVVLGRLWSSIVPVSDHCICIYFSQHISSLCGYLYIYISQRQISAWKWLKCGLVGRGLRGVCSGVQDNTNKKMCNSRKTSDQPAPLRRLASVPLSRFVRAKNPMLLRAYSQKHTSV